jgi:hypothetical protein
MTPSYPKNYENFESDQIDEQNQSELTKMEAKANLAAEYDPNSIKLKRFDELTPNMQVLSKHEMVYQDKEPFELLQQKTGLNPNNSIVRSASTKSTKSSMKHGQSILCNPFCVKPGQLQQIMEMQNRRSVFRAEHCPSSNPIANFLNCGYISDPLKTCIPKNCIPGDPFSSQRVHNTSFNMLYPGMVDNSEGSGSNVLQPIDVGLRGEHYLESEVDLERNL